MLREDKAHNVGWLLIGLCAGAFLLRAPAGPKQTAPLAQEQPAPARLSFKTEDVRHRDGQGHGA